MFEESPVWGFILLCSLLLWGTIKGKSRAPDGFKEGNLRLILEFEFVLFKLLRNLQICAC